MTPSDLQAIREGLLALLSDDVDFIGGVRMMQKRIWEKVHIDTPAGESLHDLAWDLDFERPRMEMEDDIRATLRKLDGIGLTG